MTVEVVRARPGDGPALARIHRRAAVLAYRSIFPPSAPKPTVDELAVGWTAALADPSGEVVAARIDGVVVGGAVLSPDRGVPTGWLLRKLYVDPDHWGTGIGSALHDRVLDEAARRGAEGLNLWVLEANERARGLYERLGWRLVPGPTVANDPPTVVDVLYQRPVDPGQTDGAM